MAEIRKSQDARLALAQRKGPCLRLLRVSSETPWRRPMPIFRGETMQLAWAGETSQRSVSADWARLLPIAVAVAVQRA